MEHKEGDDSQVLGLTSWWLGCYPLRWKRLGRGKQEEVCGRARRGVSFWIG